MFTPSRPLGDLKRAGRGSLSFFLLLFFLAGCLREAPPKPAADVAREAALETKVRALIVAEPILSDQPIDVEVKEGAIVLSGRVAREEQKEKAAEAAARAGGDVPIKNKITVQRKEEAAGLGRPLFASARLCSVCPPGMDHPQSAHPFFLRAITTGDRPNFFR